MTDIVFADQFDFSLFIDRFKKDVMEIVNEKSIDGCKKILSILEDENIIYYFTKDAGSVFSSVCLGVMQISEYEKISNFGFSFDSSYSITGLGGWINRPEDGIFFSMLLHTSYNMNRLETVIYGREPSFQTLHNISFFVEDNVQIVQPHGIATTRRHPKNRKE